VAGLSVGNMWSWNNGLTFGVDWLMAMAPLTTSSSSSVSGNLPQRDADELLETTESLTKDIASATSLTLALVHVGYNF
jgi:hypothetical protein